MDRSAFVVGADPRIVRHAIAARYGDAIEAATQATGDSADAAQQIVRDYVEKLIQVPYHLPRLSPAEVETYMTLLFCERHMSDLDFGKTVLACDDQRKTNRFASFGLAAAEAAVGESGISGDLRSALTFVAGASRLITENLKGNPRQVKRFLNAYILRSKLAKVAQLSTCRDDVLLKLMLLEYSDPSRFKNLSVWQEEQQGRPEELVALESGKGKVPDGWDSPRLERWVQLEPLLSQYDLSDYFWLARDKLGSSLSGVSLVPPVVRSALEALLSAVGRKTAGDLLAGLNSDEFEVLLTQLQGHLQRDPESDDGYDGLLVCARIRQECCEKVCEIISSLPKDKWPASLFGKITLLLNDVNTANQVFLNSLLELFRANPKSGPGRSAAQKDKKK